MASHRERHFVHPDCVPLTGDEDSCGRASTPASGFFETLKNVESCHKKLRAKRSASGPDGMQGLVQNGPSAELTLRDCRALHVALLHLPLELIEKIMDSCNPRDLAALEASCTELGATICQPYARRRLHQLAVPQKCLIPQPGESWISLLEFAGLQSKALAQATTLAMGAHHTAALLVSSHNPRGYVLATFGQGFHGQLGTGAFKLASWAPHVIEPINGCGSAGVPSSAVEAFQAISPAVLTAGSNHTVMVSSSGLPYSWGTASLGALGKLGVTQSATPRQLSRSTCQRVVTICAGSSHTLVVDETGQIYASGSNTYGQLGCPEILEDGCSVLMRVMLWQGQDLVCAVAAGMHHSVALTEHGEVWTWGLGSHGQLGHVAKDMTVAERSDSLNVGARQPVPLVALSPARQPLQDRITAVAAGGNQTALICVSGKLLVCGENRYGCLGFGHRMPVLHPREVHFQPIGHGPVRVVQVAIGNDHMIVLANCSGRAIVFASGYNYFGQLGLGHWRDVCAMSEVTALTGMRVISVAVGEHNSAAILEDGTLLLWGRNDSGQLGLGSDNHIPTPTKLSGFQIASFMNTLGR